MNSCELLLKHRSGEKVTVKSRTKNRIVMGCVSPGCLFKVEARSVSGGFQVDLNSCYWVHDHSHPQMDGQVEEEVERQTQESIPDQAKASVVNDDDAVSGALCFFLSFYLPFPFLFLPLVFCPILTRTTRRTRFASKCKA
jgi:hypothetical protein